MSDLSALISSVFLISVSAAIITQMSPEGELRKYIRFIAGLSVIASIAFPIISVVRSLPDKIESISSEVVEMAEFDNMEIVSAAVDNIERELCADIEAEFGFEKGSVIAEVLVDTGDLSNILITDINIILPRGFSGNVRGYVYRMFRGEPRIRITEADNG